MKSFAFDIVKMYGYTREQAINEVAGVDNVSHEEATLRYERAQEHGHKCRVAAELRSLHYQAGKRYALEDVFSEYRATGPYRKSFWLAYRRYKNSNTVSP